MDTDDYAKTRYFKAKVPDHKMEGTDHTFEKTIDDGQTIVFTDKSTSIICKYC